eukprot:TRINITY_DN6964_c0_g1_i3.p1 TRINITY_DN6964_c0_g1~~TRINITY_DN6964_c0_g1_i3.p1  ORF type:complete len:737 (-),score=159.38 TRINITY_DN6964_c0_g1_i3:992-3202(-)
MFDYWGTVIFAIAMSLWAVFFLEFWKRQQFYLQYEWDVLEYEVVEEIVRPEFETKMRRSWEKARNDKKKDKIRYENPITKTVEFFQEDYKVKAKFATTLGALATLVAVVVAIVVGVVFYRAAVSPLIAAATSRAYSENITALGQFLSIFGGLIVSTSGALIQLVFIFIMNKIYEKIAVILTAWELHRTQTDHEDSFTVKMYLFQFVNFYSSLFYIAFFKGRILVHFPGRDYGTWRGLEQCAAYGCLLELTIQLIIIFILKQTLNNFTELGIPLIKILIKYIKLYLLKRKRSPDEEGDHEEGLRKKLAATTPWGRDYQLAPERDHGLFWEYLELVIQFGFVTIFAAAFPLAPFFALFNNYFEVRIDASKFCILTRRPLASKSQDIGPWYSILDIISKIAVVTNAFLIPFTGGFIDRVLYQGETNSGVNQLNGFLDVTLNRVPIHNFILSEDFPEHTTRSLNIILNDETSGLYTPYFDPTVYYCRTAACDMMLEVDEEVSMNNSLTTCCEYLIHTNSNATANNVVNSGFRNGSCTYNSMEYCCVNKADMSQNVSRVDFQLPQALLNSTSCCNALDTNMSFSQGNNYSLASGIYYRITNDELDPDSPKNGLNSPATELKNRKPDFIPGKYYSGCNVNMINTQIECRFRPTYQLNPYADQTEQIVYYRTMMVRLLFTVIFEHLIFAIVVLVAYLVPDIPAEIKDQLYREKYLAKYAEYEEERKKRKMQEQEEELNFQAAP